MAPLSYYWIISFIYLVIKNTTHPAFFKKPVNPFKGNNGNNERHTRFFGYRVPLSFCNALWEGEKKRYVYMVQSGIMNYKGQKAGDGQC